jgi:hypothetical protein
MPPSGTNSQVEAAPTTLPLFRPEALAAQESLHGEILLIRPLSLTFLVWLGIALGGALLGFVFFGRITETAQVNGVLLPGEAASPSSRMEAVLDVPSSMAPFVQIGTSLVIRCPGCTDLGQKLAGQVVRVENPTALGSTTRVTVALPSEMAASLPKDRVGGSVAVEAEVPAGRTSLIHWLLKPSPR